MLVSLFGTINLAVVMVSATIISELVLQTFRQQKLWNWFIGFNNGICCNFFASEFKKKYYVLVFQAEIQANAYLRKHENGRTWLATGENELLVGIC